MPKIRATKTRHPRSIDISGQRHERLCAKRYIGSDGRKSWWEIACDCGRTIKMPATEFRKGKQKSCGCAAHLYIAEAQKTHGMSKHPAYAVWRSMLARCLNPKHKAFKNYGARGITVCLRWQDSFENFWADMGGSYKKGLTLERVNNNRGYSKSNCRWATYSDQARNKRGNVIIPTPKGDMPLWKAVQESGIGQTTLLYRKSVGVPAERMFDKPDTARRFTTS